MSVSRIALGITVLAGLLAAGRIDAVPVRVDFSGTVEFVDPDPGSAPPNSLAEYLGAQFTVGSPFSGYFTFNDAQPNTQDGFYSIPVPPWSVSVTIGTLALVTQESYEILVLTNPGDEPGHVNVFSRVDGNDVEASFQIYLKDRLGSPLSSSDLDDIPWTVSAFPQREASWVLQSPVFPGESVRAFGHIGFLSGPPVPEPAGIGFVALAACAMLAGCRGFSRD